MSTDRLLVDAQLDRLAHLGIAQRPVWARVVPQDIDAGRIQFGIGQVEQQALGAGAGRVADLDPFPGLGLGHVRLDQVPQKVELAGLDELLAHLAALDPAQDDGVQVGLALGLPVFVALVAHQGHVVARDPLFELEGAQADGVAVVDPTSACRPGQADDGWAESCQTSHR